METRSARVAILLLGAALWPGAAPAAEPRAVYEALRAARPAARAIGVDGLTLERDVFRLRFERGVFRFLPSLDGRPFGAVYTGSGSLELTPATEIERSHLALVTGSGGLQTLRMPFESLVLLFTDGTAADIEAKSTGEPAPLDRAEATYEAFRVWHRTELRTNLPLRLLEALLAEPPAPLFLAWLPGQRLPPSLAAVDPGGLDWLIGRVAGESSALLATGNRGGLWYCAPSLRDLARGGATPPPFSARAIWYGVETTIHADARISGTTTIRVIPALPGLRVVRLNLVDRLRLRSAEIQPAGSETWTPADVVQENPGEDSEPAALLPEAPSPGGAVRLRLTYEGGEVLRDAGDGNFLVEARDNWYPNLGMLHDLSAYELTYRHPRDLEVVSVGTRVSEGTDGDARVAVWRSDRPIRVAGFNYGRFREIVRSDAEAGMTLRVYTNRGTPDFIHSLNQSLIRLAAQQHVVTPDFVNFRAGVRADQIGVPGSSSLASAGVSPVHVDPEILADGAIADGLATARIGKAAFGPLPDSRIAITQQTQAFFGQSWPGLLYVPYIAALNESTRREIGLQGAADFIDQVVPHELAHQWWGQLIGWQGYRDRWISEGFAEYTASLVLEASGGAKRSEEYWEKARRRILDTPRGCDVSNAAAGPIAMGQRLITPRNPFAYDVIVYLKGAYVLHMLRMWMRDWQAADPDREFYETMRDFAATFAGRNPSTRDFQSVVERHVTPRMSGSEDTGMDWFFRQWVYGIDIPRLRQKLRVRRAQGGGYRLTGWMVQDGVPPDFRTVVPLFAETGKGELVHVASLRLVGNVKASLDVPLETAGRPRSVLSNAHHEVLARD
jgi:hypothetical protein